MDEFDIPRRAPADPPPAEEPYYGQPGYGQPRHGQPRHGQPTTPWPALPVDPPAAPWPLQQPAGPWPGQQPAPSWPPEQPTTSWPVPPTQSMPPSWANDRPTTTPPPIPPSGGRSASRASRSAPASRSRSVLSSVLTRLGCLAGSLAVAAFVLATIALNPARPGEVVKAALSSSAGRSVIAGAVASGLQAADPTLSPAQASADATAVVNSPALAASLGSTHGDVSNALLATLTKIDPAAAKTVAAHLPAPSGSSGGLSALPSGAVSVVDRAHSALSTAERYLVIAAILAIAAALIIGPRRGRTLTQVGWWALGASVVQLIIWLGLPKLLGHFDNSWAQIAAAALKAGGTGLLAVFVTLAVIGAACLAAGLVLRFAGAAASRA